MATTEETETAVLDRREMLRHVLVIGGSDVDRTALLRSVCAQQISRGGGIIALMKDKTGGSFAIELSNEIIRHGRQADLRVVVPADAADAITYNPILDHPSSVVAQQLLSVLEPAITEHQEAVRTLAVRGFEVLLNAINKMNLAYSFLDLMMMVLKPESLRALAAELRAQYGDGSEMSELDWLLANYSTTSPVRLAMAEVASRLSMFATGRLSQRLGAYEPDVSIVDSIGTNELVFLDGAAGGAGSRLSKALRAMMFYDIFASLNQLAERGDRCFSFFRTRLPWILRCYPRFSVGLAMRVPLSGSMYQG
jgi:hypothetical protein